MLTENKFSKYLLYAVGEIILVVIGILIALAINASYGKNVEENRTRTILEQVYADLEANIEQTDLFNDYYRRKDTLIYNVMNDKVTPTDYKQSFGNRYIDLILSYDVIKVRDNGFVNLMEHLNDVPPELVPIVNQLTTLYKEQVPVLELINENISELVHQHQKDLINSEDWYQDVFYFGRRPDSAIDYFLTDFRYKNYASQYMTVGILNHHRAMMHFRYLAYKSYVEIGDYLDISLETGEDNLSFKSKASEFSHYEGSYGTEDFPIKILIENEKMWLEGEDGTRQIIIPISKTRFQIEKAPQFATFSLDKDGIPISLKIGYAQGHTVLKRIIVE